MIFESQLSKPGILMLKTSQLMLILAIIPIPILMPVSMTKEKMEHDVFI